MPTRGRLIFTVLVAAVATATGRGHGAQPGIAELTVKPPQERNLGARAGPENHTFREQIAGCRLGPQDYSISWKACVDEAHGGKVSPLEGYVGMPGPTSCNWYHSRPVQQPRVGSEVGGVAGRIVKHT